MRGEPDPRAPARNDDRVAREMAVGAIIYAISPNDAIADRHDTFVSYSDDCIVIRLALQPTLQDDSADARSLAAAELAADHVKCFAANRLLDTHHSHEVVESSMRSPNFCVASLIRSATVLAPSLMYGCSRSASADSGAMAETCMASSRASASRSPAPSWSIRSSAGQ